MAKYLIDLDSLYECLDMISEGKINGNDYAYLQNIKYFIHRFPKDKVEESVNIRVERDIEIGEYMKNILKD